MEKAKIPSVESQIDQVKKEALRRHRDEDMRDDDLTVADGINDSKLRQLDDNDAAGTDAQNLSDGDVGGNDLDTDNKNEWDSAKYDNNEPDENINYDELKHDKGIGGIGFLPGQHGMPEPDEIPEEHTTDNEEVVYEEKEELEKPIENERPNVSQTEVSKPLAPEAPTTQRP